MTAIRTQDFMSMKQSDFQRVEPSGMYPWVGAKVHMVIDHIDYNSIEPTVHFRLMVGSVSSTAVIPAGTILNVYDTNGSFSTLTLSSPVTVTIL